MVLRYRVHEVLDANGNGTGFYRLGRYNSNLSELPLILCPHMHPTIEAAAVCTYFGPHA